MSIFAQNERAVVARAAELVEGWTGITIPDYRWEPLADELRLAGKGTLQAGLRHLEQGDMDLRNRIVNNIAIGETYFFRHFGHFEALREFAIARRNAGAGCNVLSAGCSTGEEAWSAACVLGSVYLPESRDFKVTGWELSAKRIEAAKARKYRTWSVRQGLFGLERFITEKNGQWRVEDSLSAHAQFRAMNLITDAYPQEKNFDVIFFRNVSIYWKPASVAEVIHKLSNLLSHQGLLMTGPSDPVSPDKSFATLSAGGVRYYAKTGTAPTMERAQNRLPDRALVPVSSEPQSC